MRELGTKLDALREMVAANHSQMVAYVASRDERERQLTSDIVELRDRTRKNSDRFAQLNHDITDLRLWRAKVIGVMAGVSFVGGLVGSIMSS